MENEIHPACDPLSPILGEVDGAIEQQFDSCHPCYQYEFGFYLKEERVDISARGILFLQEIRKLPRAPS